MDIYKKPKGMNNFSVYLQHHDYPYPHKHTYWEFLILIKGTLIHKINGENKTISQNTLWVIRPDDGHSLHNLPGETSNHITLRVSCEYITTFLNIIHPNLKQSLLTTNKPLCFQLKSTTINRIINSTNKIFTASQKKDYETHCTILFLDIFRAFYYQLIKLEKTSEKYSTLVTKLIYLINDPENLKKDIKTLIQECGYSYSHANRVFTAETGMSPSKYLKQQRLNYAQLLLTETDMDYLTIAQKIGYTSYSHFWVAFQKGIGSSPNDFRKTNNTQ